jgi:phasin
VTSQNNLHQRALREATPMNTTAKPKSADVMQQFREVSDTGTQRSREMFETIGAATTEAADVMKNCCSTALKGVQDYNSKLAEYSQANIRSYVEFVQRLAGVKSPSEFIEVTTAHARHQLETVGEQAKQLADITQKVAIATADPLKTSFAKVSNRAA